MQPRRIEPLISVEEPAARVWDLAARISADYRGRELLVVGVLKGAFVFCADLLRHLEGTPAQVDFIACSSDETATETPGVVRILKGLNAPVADRDRVAGGEHLDVGLTLQYLRAHLRSRARAACAPPCS